MIKTIRHKGLRQFFLTGNTSGVNPQHSKRLRILLAALDTAFIINDMDLPGFRLHSLRGRENDR